MLKSKFSANIEQGSNYPLPLLNAACHPVDAQGTLLNSWRAVWVVLSEDGVEFYKKKTDRSPKGMIPLKGATLISPCQDFSKRMVRKHLTVKHIQILTCKIFKIFQLNECGWYSLFSRLPQRISRITSFKPHIWRRGSYGSRTSKDS